jgi:hypothetical protein
MESMEKHSDVQQRGIEPIYQVVPAPQPGAKSVVPVGAKAAVPAGADPVVPARAGRLFSQAQFDRETYYRRSPTVRSSSSRKVCATRADTAWPQAVDGWLGITFVSSQHLYR